jgi:hypothetical protein
MNTLSLCPLPLKGEGTELQESHFSPLAPGGREPERGGTNDAKR